MARAAMVAVSMSWQVEDTSSSRANGCRRAVALHLLVSVDKKVIEAFNVN